MEIVFLFLFALFFDDLGQETQVLQEVILVLVLRVDFKNANDAVVACVDEVVKLRAVLERDHAVQDVLLEDLVRVAADLIQTGSSLIDILVSLIIVFSTLRLNVFFVRAAVKNLASAVTNDWLLADRFGSLLTRLFLSLNHPLIELYYR